MVLFLVIAAAVAVGLGIAYRRRPVTVCADEFDNLLGADRTCCLRAGHRGDHTDGAVAWYDED